MSSYRRPHPTRIVLDYPNSTEWQRKMGIFYSNITLKLKNQKAIAEFLNSFARNAYVSPSAGEYTVIFDKDAEESVTNLTQLAVLLSKKFSCPAFAVDVQDGDVFTYFLYGSGKLLDEYHSCPNYYNDSDSTSPIGGDAGILCKVFQMPSACDDVNEIFDRAALTATAEDWSDEQLIGDEIHDVLVQALGMPLFTIDTGYYSIVNDSLPDDLDKASLIYCGSH